MRLGIDVLAARRLQGTRGKRVGLITNHTGVDSNGDTTVELLHKAPNVKLVALFSPEHGIRGKFDQPEIGDTIDEKTGLPVYSLYGKNRKPSDGAARTTSTRWCSTSRTSAARFYTYTSTMGLAMEAAARSRQEVRRARPAEPDRRRSCRGSAAAMTDTSRSSAFYNVPVRHGMTIGELARMYKAEKKLDLDLVVVPVEGWRRSEYLFDTGLTWINPSPNMRSLEAAVLYPGIGLLETTNVSVGRGTDTPFEVMGAPWINERELAAAINAAAPPGVRVVPIRFTPTASKFKGEECGGVNFIITDWNEFRSLDLGFRRSSRPAKAISGRVENKGIHQAGGQQIHFRPDYGGRRSRRDSQILRIRCLRIPRTPKAV